MWTDIFNQTTILVFRRATIRFNNRQKEALNNRNVFVFAHCRDTRGNFNMDVKHSTSELPKFLPVNLWTTKNKKKSIANKTIPMQCEMNTKG